MSEAIYRQLQQKLDDYSVGFPATSTGVEIKILRKLFREDDARIFLVLSPLPESAAGLAPKLGLSEAEAAARLEDMTDRGLLFRLGPPDARRYGAIPFVHGLFEFQVKRLDQELADLIEQYFRDGFKANMIANAGGFLRTVPVDQAVAVENRIAAYEDASEILRGKDLIVVTECICRKAKAMVADGCGKPSEVCYMFGSMAQYYLDHGMGRQVSADEAVAILLAAQKAGLVTQPASAQNPAGMCNCCGDCCGVLHSIAQHPRPAEVVFSNHSAEVDADGCTGCGDCETICQMDAIAVGDGGTATVNRDRCIGCGLCVIACTAGAARLAAKPESERKTPPRNSMEQMIAMARKRGVL